MKSLLMNIRFKIFSLTTLILFLAYAVSASSQLIPNESADLLSGPMNLGLLNSPGFPLFTLLGFLFSKIFWFLDPAHRMHLMNAVLGAGAGGVFTLVVFVLFENSVLAVLGGLILGLTSSTWMLATSSEVFTLDLLLNNILWLLLLEFYRNRSPQKLGSFCLVFGLSLTNCYPLTLLSAIGMILVLRKIRTLNPQVFDGKTLLRCFGCLALGLIPYLYIVIQSLRINSVGFVSSDYGTGDNAWSYVTRTSMHFFNGSGTTLFEKWNGFWLLLYAFAKDFALAFIPVVFGIYAAFKNRFEHRWAFLIALLMNTVGLFLLLNNGIDSAGFAKFRLYLLPATAYLTVFAMFGLHWFYAHYKLANSLWIAGVSLMLLTQLTLSYSRVKIQNEPSAEAIGTAVLKSLPSQSNLILCNDEGSSLRYLQKVKGVGAGINLYNYSIATDGRLFVAGPLDKPGIPAPKLIGELFKDTGTPTYLNDCKHVLQDRGIQVVNKGLTYQLLTAAIPEQAGMQITKETLRSLLDSFGLDDLPKGGANGLQRQRQRSAALLTAYAYQMNILTAQELTDLLKVYDLAVYPPFLGAMAAELAYNGERSLTVGLKYFQEIDQQDLYKVDPDDVSVYCRILLAANNQKLAQVVCTIPDEASRNCNGDTKYDMGQAFWKRKDKSLKYLKEALACMPRATQIQDAIAKRESEP